MFSTRLCSPHSGGSRKSFSKGESVRLLAREDGLYDVGREQRQVDVAAHVGAIHSHSRGQRVDENIAAVLQQFFPAAPPDDGQHRGTVRLRGRPMRAG